MFQNKHFNPNSIRIRERDRGLGRVEGVGWEWRVDMISLCNPFFEVFWHRKMFKSWNFLFFNMQRTNSEKRNDKERLEEVRRRKFSFHSAESALLLSRKLLHFLCTLLCYLVVQENVQTKIKGKTQISCKLRSYIWGH